MDSLVLGLVPPLDLIVGLDVGALDLIVGLVCPSRAVTDRLRGAETTGSTGGR